MQVATALAAAAFLASAAAPVLAQGVAPGGTVEAKHGAWSTVCGTPPGAPGRQCALMQLVVAKDQPNVAISVVALKTADGEARILKILTPLGVLLPKGLGLFIDGKSIGRAYFLVCREEGCQVEVTIDDQLLKTLKSGKQAVFTLYKTQEEGIGIPVDLTGFGEGFDALP
ncbi:invasion associated locus B family protein [Pararhizobium mangrovi]|uniref:invasion associated locus B family protein n=1 Tax=Pararhizobium mangrovi TaxID=2590452 RepID=UPI0038B32982